MPLYSPSLSLEHSLPRSLYPQRLPPQSSLILLPERVMPYRSHEHPDDAPLLTLLGELLLLLRELSDGTLELQSLSDSLLSLIHI